MGLFLPQSATTPVSNIQALFFKPVTDTNQDGNLTQQEVTARIQALRAQVPAGVPTPGTTLQTELSLLEGLNNNFTRLANSRGLGDDQIRTQEFRPEDATIQANELQAAARVDGIPTQLSRRDFDLLQQGRPIPSAPGSSGPTPPTIPPVMPPPPPLSPSPIFGGSSVPTGQIPTVFFKAATDTDQNGSLTQQEVSTRIQTLVQQLVSNTVPATERQAALTELTLLEGLRNNFSRVANSRGLGDDQPRTQEFRPEDATVEANELAAVARVDGVASQLSRTDFNLLQQGRPIPSANPTNPPAQPNPMGALAQLYLKIMMTLMTLLQRQQG